MRKNKKKTLQVSILQNTGVLQNASVYTIQSSAYEKDRNLAMSTIIIHYTLQHRIITNRSILDGCERKYQRRTKIFTSKIC